MAPQTRILALLHVVAALAISSRTGAASDTAATCDADATRTPPDEGTAHATKLAQTIAGSDDTLTQNLLIDLLSQGSSIHPALRVRHLDPTDINSPRGIFTTSALQKGEALFTVPWSVTIDSNYENDRSELIGSEDDSEDFDEWEDCATVWGIYDAMTTRPTPYGQYLKSQPEGYIPGYWSRGGMDLLSNLLGPSLPPQEAFVDKKHYHWLDNCPGATDDEMQLHAAMLQAARSDNDLMIPFYDMFNHRNGKWYNVHHKSVDGVSFSLVANRNIEAGEQLYNSYSQCNICGPRDHDRYGTPDLWEEYGFVEPYPQRWYFDDESRSIRFELDEVDTSTSAEEREEEKKELKVTFTQRPNEEGVQYLRTELDRLNKFEVEWKDEKEVLGCTDMEWNMVWGYHGAVVVAISTALGQM